jgi:ribosome-binding factor A
MSRHGHGQAPSQRQLRVAEQMRHILAESLMRGELHEPDLDSRSITISEVRISRDLRAATVFASELGRPLSAESAAALQRAARMLAGHLARTMNLRYAPRLEFVADELFDHAERIEHLLADERHRTTSGSDDDAGA